MKRKITAEEVKNFFEACNKEFEEAGFVMHDIHFTRAEDGTLRSVTLNYTENDMLFSCTKSYAQGARQPLQGQNGSPRATQAAAKG